MGKVQLKYRTFNSLLNDVMVDFSNYSLEGLVEPQQLIKVAKRVSKELGLKIYQTKETILELDRFKVKLPDDFYIFNSGVLCGERTVITPNFQGTHMKEVPFVRYQEQDAVIDTCGPELCPTPTVDTCGSCGTCNTCTQKTYDYSGVNVPGYNPLVPYGDRCTKPRVFMNCKGEEWELIQIVDSQQYTYKQFMPLRLVSYSSKAQDFTKGYYLEGSGVDGNSPNWHVKCTDEIWIKDGFLHSSMKYGKIYISYEGSLEDEEGNLLVLDHDIINDYYEYALKSRILENLYINGEEVQNKIALIDARLRLAKINAITIARMPDFQDLYDVWRNHREYYKRRYVDMFIAYGWYQ